MTRMENFVAMKRRNRASALDNRKVAAFPRVKRRDAI
jgi:hypothetical protein